MENKSLKPESDISPVIIGKIPSDLTFTPMP